MKNIRRIILSVMISVSGNCAFSQGTFSPYSLLGIGDFSSKSLSHQSAMGGVGIAMPSVWHINSLNPALLIHNTLTTFEFGINGESRNISNVDSAVNVGSGGFHYLNFSFPVLKARWTTHVGIMPFSVVSGNFITKTEIPGRSEEFAEVEIENSGGLNQINFSNGFQISKYLSIGMQVSYLFGAIELRRNTTISGGAIATPIPAGFYERTEYSGSILSFGVAYRILLSDDNMFNLGLTYGLSKDLVGRRISREERQSGTQTVIGDDISEDVRSSFQLPQKIGFGVSWQKLNMMTIGFDAKYSHWSKNAGFGSDKEEYHPTWVFGLGFEITPNFNDVNHYYNRVKYRLGFNYEQNPNVIAGFTIDDIGMTLGASLPVRGVSAINFAMKIGRRGRVTNNLIKEDYVKLMFGATINDRWFVRRKYN